MSPEQARALFRDQLGPNDALARYGEKAAVSAIDDAFRLGMIAGVTTKHPEGCSLLINSAEEVIGCVCGLIRVRAPRDAS